MRTIEMKIFSFDELSETAKQNAINSCRNEDFSFLYDEAYDTVKTFHNLTDETREGISSWLDVICNFDDNVLNLTGLRLRKWILNNWGTWLYKPKYIGSIEKDEIYNHKRIKSQPLSNGKVFNPYYSAIQKTDSCVLTGVCYDIDLLQPIYDFIEKPNQYNIEDIVGFCFENLRNSIDNEIDYRNSNEGVIDEIYNMSLEFDENGNVY